MTQEITQKYRKQNIDYWTNRAAGYSEVNKEELATAQHIIWKNALRNRIQDHFTNRHFDTIKILDAGTGPGFFAIIMAECGFAVTACDCTAAMLEQAKANASYLAESIRFVLTNNEELAFDDESFDVIITRNVTWNLQQPAKAYAEWARVLKPGGLLLNFDANWYRYLFDEKAKQEHLLDRDNVYRQCVADDTAGTDVDEMEDIARQAPLSQIVRPAWDLDVLTALGLAATADERVWREVWTTIEIINNASTPMFMVKAVKPE